MNVYNITLNDENLTQIKIKANSKREAFKQYIENIRDFYSNSDRLFDPTGRVSNYDIGNNQYAPGSLKDIYFNFDNQLTSYIEQVKEKLSSTLSEEKITKIIYDPLNWGICKEQFTKLEIKALKVYCIERCKWFSLYRKLNINTLSLTDEELDKLYEIEINYGNYLSIDDD